MILTLSTPPPSGTQMGNEQQTLHAQQTMHTWHTKHDDRAHGHILSTWYTEDDDRCTLGIQSTMTHIKHLVYKALGIQTNLIQPLLQQLQQAQGQQAHEESPVTLNTLDELMACIV